MEPIDLETKKCCPNCSQPYQFQILSTISKINLPLFLECGHTVCENCIRNIVKFHEPIECRICQKCMEIDSSESCLLIQEKFKFFKKFPVNLQMLGELAFQLIQIPRNSKKDSNDDDYYIDLKTLMKSTENTQGPCLECKKMSSKICQQCATILCEACFNKSHKNFAIFKNHVLQNIESILTTNCCNLHNDKQLDYYCNDCSKPICIDCLMVGGEKSCKNHNTTSKQEVNDKFIEELGNIAPKLYEAFKRLTKTAVDIGNILYHIENENEANELTRAYSTTEQHFSKLCYAVQKHKQENLDIINKLKCSEKDSLMQAKTVIAAAIEKANKVLNMINLTSDPKKLKHMNLSVIFNEAKEITEAPWYLSRSEIGKEPLKAVVDEELCALVNDFLHLDGNAEFVYKLQRTQDLGDNIEIPPPPDAPVFPPELPKDVREQNKAVTEREKDNQRTSGFFKLAPKYRNKSNSVTSLNSNSSDSSHQSLFNYADLYKPMQPVSPFVESQHPKQLREGTQELIYITHIVDPHNFYVQRVCQQAMVKEMLREFRNAKSLPKPSLNHVAEGKLYLAFNEADKMWQRCRVISIDKRHMENPVFHVFCIDFGSTESVKIDKLRLLPPARVQSPYPLAINCSISNCEPKTGAWTNHDAYLIQHIVDNKQAVIHIRRVCSTSNYTVKLECDVTTFEHGVSIAHALVFHDRARMPNPKLPYLPVAQENPKLFISNNDFKYKAIEEVTITHTVNPDKFFVRKRHLQKTYENLCEEMDQEYCANITTETIYLPEIGMACAVQTERGGWARGVVRETPGRGRVRVWLADCGRTHVLHYSALRYLRDKFTKAAALATECHLAGVTPLHKKWNTGSVALLQKYEDTWLELHVQDNRSKGSIGVTLFDKSDPDDVVCINNLMIKYKFAISFGLFKFNTNEAVEEQVITNKNPLDVQRPKAKPQTENIKILKRQCSVQEKEEDLEAKDKGPLRLEAKLLYYKSPSLIYVSLIHQQKAFNKLFENIQKFYSNNKDQTKAKDWNVGDRCCTLCIQSQTWRRAVILEIEGENVKVFYSDFACTETVPICSLRELTSEFASIGDAAIKCHLCGVIPAVGDEWPSLTKEYLGDLLEAYQRIFITKLGNFKDKSMPVEIWVYHTTQGGALEPNQSEWRCLNNKIIDQGLAIPDKTRTVSNSENSQSLDEILAIFNISGTVREWLQLEPQESFSEPKKSAECRSETSTPIDQDDNVTVSNSSKVVFISDWLPPEPLPSHEFTAMPTYIDNDGVIYLHDVSQNDTLELIQKALDVRFKKPDHKAKYAKWSIGEPCIALFFLDNRFYRGKVLEVNEESSTCLIHYIDYGNEEICSFENLRKNIALHEIPVQAHKCFLHGIKPVEKHWDRNALDYIHKSIVEKECYVKVCGEPVEGVIPVDLKYNKLWINSHLVDFEMAEYVDGSKAVIKRFAPSKLNEDVGDIILVESDGSPDYIIEKEPNSPDLLATSKDSYDALQGKDWNMLMEEEEIDEDIIITFPKNEMEEFRCNISSINDPNILELSILHDDKTTSQYNQLFSTVQSEGGDRPPLNGIYENKACIAIFPEDNLWYRASILQYSSTQNRIKVRFVDYGNIEVISPADVREIKDEWAELPPVTISAKLYNVQLSPDAEMNSIVKVYTDVLLDKGPFHTKIIEYENDIPCVELRNDNNVLINKMLTKNTAFLEASAFCDN